MTSADFPRAKTDVVLIWECIKRLSIFLVILPNRVENRVILQQTYREKGAINKIENFFKTILNFQIFLNQFYFVF